MDRERRKGQHPVTDCIVSITGVSLLPKQLRHKHTHTTTKRGIECMHRQGQGEEKNGGIKTREAMNANRVKREKEELSCKMGSSVELTKEKKHQIRRKLVTIQTPGHQQNGQIKHTDGGRRAGKEVAAAVVFASQLILSLSPGTTGKDKSMNSKGFHRFCFLSLCTFEHNHIVSFPSFPIHPCLRMPRSGKVEREKRRPLRDF